MAQLGEIQMKSGTKDIDQVMNYLYQLEEQLRYALNNLDSENIRDGSISAEQLSGTINARLSTLERAAERVGEKGTDKLINEALSIDKTGIRLLNGGFALDLLGNLSARGLTFPNGEAARKTAESLPFRVHIGGDKPEGGAVLWLKPGTASQEGQACQVFYIPEEENA